MAGRANGRPEPEVIAQVSQFTMSLLYLTKGFGLSLLRLTGLSGYFP